MDSVALHLLNPLCGNLKMSSQYDWNLIQVMMHYNNVVSLCKLPWKCYGTWLKYGWLTRPNVQPFFFCPHRQISLSVEPLLLNDWILSSCPPSCSVLMHRISVQREKPVCSAGEFERKAMATPPPPRLALSGENNWLPSTVKWRTICSSTSFMWPVYMHYARRCNWSCVPLTHCTCFVTGILIKTELLIRPSISIIFRYVQPMSNWINTR